MAGWLHHFPEYGRTGSKKLPRAWRSLKGWKRLAPPRARKPRSYPLVCAMAAELTRRGRRDIGQWILVGHGGYFRPNENLALRQKDLVPPSTVCRHWVVVVAPEEEGRPAKNKEYDDSVTFDLQYLKYLDAIFKQLRGAGGRQRVWQFNYAELLNEWRPAARALGCPDFVPYELRHSGPSWERMRGWRSLPTVQKRGRWKALKSVMRYEKAGRLQQQMAQVPAVMAKHYAACESQIEVLLRGRLAPAKPPRSG